MNHKVRKWSKSTLWYGTPAIKILQEMTTDEREFRTTPEKKFYMVTTSHYRK